MGDFELLSELGRGGMGTVYEARQKSLQRTVALKVLSGQISASGAAVQRFQREAQAAAKLHHTHIVPVFAQGENQGIYYYAMELVDGPSLNSILVSAREQIRLNSRREGLVETVALAHGSTPRAIGAESASGRADTTTILFPSSATATVSATGSAVARLTQFFTIAEHIANVADALEYAHQRGVVHRDIKPHNLMLGGDGRLRVSDFGLARLAEQPAVTLTGEMLGSPLYMSPEQIVEGPSNVDARTDVYSLGVTLYEWLTLRPPFLGETRESIISMIVHADPLPPRAHDAAIPADLEIICMKAMERDRTRRYATAAAFRDDLRRFIARKKIAAKRASVPVRTWRLVTRHPMTALASMTAAALIVIAALALVLFRKASNLETHAQAVRNAEAETSHILDVMSKMMAVEVGLPRQGAQLAAPVAQGLLETAKGLSSGGSFQANLPTELAPVATPAGLAKRALVELYESSQPKIWPLPSPDTPHFVTGLLGNALTRWNTDPKTALGFLDGFMGFQPNHYEARELHAVLAGQLDDHERMATDTEELVRLRSDQPKSFVWRGLSHLLAIRGEQAQADLTRAVELDGQSGWAKALLGLALLQVGRTAEAITAFDGALALAPNLVIALLGRAIARAEGQGFTDAIADVSLVLEARPDDAEALTIRGDFLSQMGDYVGAVRDFDRVMALGPAAPALMMRWFLAMNQKRRAAESTESSGELPPAPGRGTGSDASPRIPQRGSSRPISSSLRIRSS